jgi:RNA polymerase-binding transcription factor DksA
VTTALDTEHFKQRLLDEQRRVKEALDYIHEENRGQLEDDREEIPSDNHPGDMATSTFDRELDATLEGNEERLLQAIDAALAAHRAWDVRDLPEVRPAHPEERLEALPWTTRCIDCKRREERG